MSDKQTSEARLIQLLRSPKRRKFAIAYVENGGKPTEAAETAGFAAPREEGYRLLRDAAVQEAIEVHANIVGRVSGETRETVLDRIRNRAQANMKDYFRRVQVGDSDVFTDELIPISELPRNAAARIKSLTPTNNGTKIELHDVAAADRDLARLMGLEPKEQENLTAEDAASLIAAALDRMDELDASEPSGD